MKMRHVTVHTENFEKEIEFYEKYAGLEIRRDMRSSGRNMVFLSGGEEDTQIEIIETEGAGNSGRGIPVYDGVRLQRQPRRLRRRLFGGGTRLRHPGPALPSFRLR